MQLNIKYLGCDKFADVPLLCGSSKLCADQAVDRVLFLEQLGKLR